MGALRRGWRNEQKLAPVQRMEEIREYSVPWWIRVAIHS
jgi:hypothetical protein